jgi:hypothetical protein
MRTEILAMSFVSLRTRRVQELVASAVDHLHLATRREADEMANRKYWLRAVISVAAFILAAPAIGQRLESNASPPGVQAGPFKLSITAEKDLLDRRTIRIPCCSRTQQTILFSRASSPRSLHNRRTSTIPRVDAMEAQGSTD